MENYIPKIIQIHSIILEIYVKMIFPWIFNSLYLFDTAESEKE